MRYYESLVRAIHENVPSKRKELQVSHPRFFDPAKQEEIDELTEKEWLRQKEESSREKK